MNVLVTGATGLVGGAVARALLRHGHGVVGLVRDPARAEELARLGMAVRVGDMWRRETYQHLPADVDAVVHAAQYRPPGRFSRSNIRQMHESDALMTRALAKACLERDKLFVYTSGGLVYKGYPDWIDEDAPLRPILLARGHAEMEAELLALHRERGLKVIIITPGFVYGPGGLFLQIIELLREGRYNVMGRGENFWSMTHVEDLAEAYVMALQRGRPGGRYFVVDDEPLPRRSVIDRISDGLKVPRAGSIMPFVVGVFMGFALVEAMKVSMKLRNDRAKTELGWRPRYRTFAEGLPSVLAGLQGVNR